MDDNKKQPPEDDSGLEQPEDEYGLDDAAAEGIYEICKAVADLLRNPKVGDAVTAWLESRTAKAAQSKSPIPYYVSLFFGLLIFTGIAILAARKILDPQSTVVLIGALIAAWYGGQRPRQ